eukprot:4488748-Prymnesium_polylepis.1
MAGGRGGGGRRSHLGPARRGRIDVAKAADAARVELWRADVRAVVDVDDIPVHFRVEALEGETPPSECARRNEGGGETHSQRGVGSSKLEEETGPPPQARGGGGGESAAQARVARRESGAAQRAGVGRPKARRTVLGPDQPAARLVAAIVGARRRAVGAEAGATLEHRVALAIAVVPVARGV